MLVVLFDCAQLHAFQAVVVIRREEVGFVELAGPVAVEGWVVDGGPPLLDGCGTRVRCADVYGGVACIAAVFVDKF